MIQIYDQQEQYIIGVNIMSLIIESCQFSIFSRSFILSAIKSIASLLLLVIGPNQVITLLASRKIFPIIAIWYPFSTVSSWLIQRALIQRVTFLLLFWIFLRANLRFFWISRRKERLLIDSMLLRSPLLPYSYDNIQYLQS